MTSRQASLTSEYAGRESPPRTSEHRALNSVIAILTVLSVITVVETGRRLGVPVPVPFLMLYGGVAIGAGFAGLRIGLVCATLAAGFVIWCAYHDFGPQSLTGGPAQVLVGVFIAYLSGGLLGHHYDKLSRMAKELAIRDRKLTDMHALLLDKVERRTDQLAKVSTELDTVRHRLDSAVENSPAGVIIVGTNREVISANRAALDLFGIGSIPDQWLQPGGLFDQERITVTSVGSHGRSGALTKALTAGEVTDGHKIRADLSDGTEKHLSCSFAPIKDPGGEVKGATVICLDETDMFRYQQSLEKLSRRLINAQEEERKAIARELHDEIGQHLTGIKMLLHASAKGPDDRTEIFKCIDRVDELMRVVRNLSLSLRPPVLDDLGLVAALRSFLSKQHLPNECDLHFDSSAATAALSPETTTASFRIVQEAVNNAIKYAGARNIRVRLYNDDDDFCIEVEDDGHGFDQHQFLNGSHDNPGLGLLFMQERARELFGTCNISSTIGAGTTVTARFPIAVAG